MDRLRTFFGYKSLDDANLCAKEPVDLKQDENAYVREMIHRATSDMLMGSDWALNMEVVDFVNRSDAKIKESVASTLSNRLNYGDSHVRSLVLTLTDSCVKNCGQDFRKFLARPTHFGKTLVNIVTSSDAAACSDALRDQILALILDWKNVSPDFEDAFRTLKFKHNVSFPASDSSCVPISTPPARYATKEAKEEEANQAAIAAILRETGSQGHPSSQGGDQRSSFVVVNQQQSTPAHPASFQPPTQTNVVYNVVNNVQAGGSQSSAHQSFQGDVMAVGATIGQEVDTLWNSCALLKEILENVDTTSRNAIDAALSDDLVVSIMQQCKIGKKEITTTWISCLNDESVLHKALTLNDEIDFCITLHDSLRTAAPRNNAAATMTATTSGPSGATSGGVAGGHDLYANIFAQKQGPAPQSNSNGKVDSTEEEPVTLSTSEMVGAVELKDIVFTNTSAASTPRKPVASPRVFDQPDLISFDSPEANSSGLSASASASAEEGSTASATASARTSAQANAQASRMDDLLSL